MEHPDDVPVVLSGYNHIDVLTAAGERNDGRLEAVSEALAEFARR
ncbi:hypothetical protein [Rhodococcus artemisiae]|uniref:Uncharacterized protein n=1 Tax=Rhodococcus artemisiae TaxID=714159 RepID=A0ABU7LDJ4_9NOCA|nr:hypothetical protein [Rhodococcus artemisiae]MEE2059631.1 hypothetical protein [Rhodococcus artemisiae]